MPTCTAPSEAPPDRTKAIGSRLLMPMSDGGRVVLTPRRRSDGVLLRTSTLRSPGRKGNQVLQEERAVRDSRFTRREVLERAAVGGAAFSLGGSVLAGGARGARITRTVPARWPSPAQVRA